MKILLPPPCSQMRDNTLMRHFWELNFNSHLKSVYFGVFFSYYWWDFTKSGWISLTFLREDTRTSLPLKQLISVNRLSFPHTLIPSLVFRQGVFLLVLVKYNLLLETASWKHKLQSHVPLLYSSSTCNLGAKISKLATPNSPTGAQAGIGSKALLGSPATCPHSSYSGWHLPLDHNMAMGMWHHEEPKESRLYNMSKVQYKVRNVPVTWRGRVADTGPDWINPRPDCLNPVCCGRAPQQQNCHFWELLTCTD